MWALVLGQTSKRGPPEAEKVDIRLHNIIYDVINEIKPALEGLLEPEKSEEVLATVEVRETFKVPKVSAQLQDVTCLMARL